MSRRLEVWSGLAVVWLGGVLLGGCAKQPADLETLPEPPRLKSMARTLPPSALKGTVGVSLLTMSNPFFIEMGQAMLAEGAKQGYEVKLQAGDLDAARQKDQVKDFIVKKVSAIVLCPCDSKAVGTAIAEANKAGIPVFTADIASLDPAAKVVSHVATDNYAGGKLAGEEIVKLLGGKGKMAIIDHPEVESAMQRTKGLHDVVDKVPEIQIVAQLPGKGSRDESLKTAQDILEKNQDLNLIFAINDPTAFGVVAALEKAKLAGKVQVVGFDGMPEAKQAVKDGKIAADIVQYSERIGKTVIEQVAKHLAGEKVEPQVLMETGVYRKADADKDPALRKKRGRK
jgi:ribose transport system substrate-binding protein